MIPKVEVDNLFDLDESYLAEMVTFARRIAKAFEKALQAINECENLLSNTTPTVYYNFTAYFACCEVYITFLENWPMELSELTKKKLIQKPGESVSVTPLWQRHRDIVSREE